LEEATIFGKEEVVSNLNGNLKLNGGSTIKTLKVKTTLVQTGEITLFG
jgi:hypothetical protein